MQNSPNNIIYVFHYDVQIVVHAQGILYTTDSYSILHCAKSIIIRRILLVFISLFDIKTTEKGHEYIVSV